MEEGRKYKIPRGPAATAAKNKYRAENYDRIELAVLKGRKADIQAHAKAQGESVNSFISRAISETMKRDKEAGE